MEATLVRIVWACVEACHHDQRLLDLSDSVLIQHIFSQLRRQVLLSDQESSVLRQYLRDRIFLIRDVIDITA
jgi:hypothetical protein